MILGTAGLFIPYFYWLNIQRCSIRLRKSSTPEADHHEIENCEIVPPSPSLISDATFQDPIYSDLPNYEDSSVEE